MQHAHHIAVLLHNIRSAHNVGAIFRTADAAGVSKIILTGYTPAPLDRFGRPRSDVAKAALGTQMSVPWRKCARVSDAINDLRKDEWQLVAVEQAPNATDYRRYHVTKPICFIFGNEVRGLSNATLAKCDYTIAIPMHRKKESLNVSVAAGIILFHTLGR